MISPKWKRMEKDIPNKMSMNWANAAILRSNKRDIKLKLIKEIERVITYSSRENSPKDIVVLNIYTSRAPKSIK